MSNLKQYAMEYYDSDSNVKRLTTELETAKSVREEKRKQLVAELIAEDLPECAVDDVDKRFVIQKERHASYLVENREHVLEAMRGLGYSDIIKTDIHNKSFNSAIKELTEDGALELPDGLKDLVKVYEVDNISIRRR